MTSAYILAECFSAAPYAFGDFFQECQRDTNAFRFLHVFEVMLPENPWCVEIAGPAGKCCALDISLLFETIFHRLHTFSSHHQGISIVYTVAKDLHFLRIIVSGYIFFSSSLHVRPRGPSCLRSKTRTKSHPAREGFV